MSHKGNQPDWDKIAEKFTVCSYELLRVFDGVKGYSMAQGQ